MFQQQLPRMKSLEWWKCELHNRTCWDLWVGFLSTFTDWKSGFGDRLPLPAIRIRAKHWLTMLPLQKRTPEWSHSWVFHPWTNRFRIRSKLCSVEIMQNFPSPSPDQGPGWWVTRAQFGEKYQSQHTTHNTQILIINRYILLFWFVIYKPQDVSSLHKTVGCVVDEPCNGVLSPSFRVMD